jgi:hypothetical protein
VISFPITKTDISSITIEQIKNYLLASGWTRESDYKNSGSIWIKNEEQEILVPETRDISDYFSRIADVLTLLESEEQRPIYKILTDIKALIFDVTKIRSVSAESSDGTIEIEKAVKLFTGAKDMMLSAALAVWEPKAYYKNKPPKKVGEFLKRVRLGQTEKGSYIITILTKPEQAGALFAIPSYEKTILNERLVIENLSTSLSKIKTIISENVDIRNPNVLHDAYSAGVSANLCISILDMYEASSGGELEISFKLSQKTDLTRDFNSHITFTSEGMPKIREAYEILKSDSQEQKTTLTGLVIGLSRPEGAEIGKVILATIVDGRGRNVVLSLTLLKYLEAVKAHENDHLVRVNGTLTRNYNNYQFETVDSFNVLADNLFS